MHDSRSLVRVIWEVCPRGYDIVRRDESQSKWPGDIRPDFLGKDCVGDFIVARDESRREYEADLLEHEVFRDLVNSAQQPGPDGVLQFVNKWGLLTKLVDPPLNFFLRERDSVVRALGNVEDMADLMLSVSRSSLSPWRGGVGWVDTRVERMGRGKLQLHFEAQTLLQFCTLELLHIRTRSVDITACGACGLLLPLHKEGRPKAYCDDACKMVAYRKRNSDRRKRRSSP
jgi:hypothetical protein